MNNYTGITYKYLKQQRNRTLLTILGIILSVAMISSIGTIIEATRGAMIKDAINNHGSYHIKFSNLDKDQINTLEKHVEVDEIGVSKKEGAARIAKVTEAEKRKFGENAPYRYINIKGYEENSLKLLPYDINEGRIPTRSDELVIEKWVLSYLEEDVQLGDSITLPIGNRKLDSNNKETGFELIAEKEYTIVGFIQPKFKWSGDFITNGISGINTDDVSESYEAYFTLTNIKDASKKANNIAKDIGLGLDDISLNNKLLRLSAESTNEMFNETLGLILLFIVGLIVISTVAVIYNAFNISVLERISQFGLLRSVGATPKQIRGIVLREAFILSIVSIPIGFLSGIGAMNIVFYIIGNLQFDINFFRDMEVNMSLTVFLISAGIGLVTVFLSAIGPAIKAGKVSPLEAVRNIGGLKKETFKKAKSSFFVRKILGVEGEIAYKNLRRNRKRFIITVFSMVISISLFITFASFSDYMFKAGVIEETTAGDFSVRTQDTGEFHNIYEELKTIKDVKRVYKVKEVNGKVLLREDKISEAVIDDMPYVLEEKQNGLNVIDNINFHTIGDENFELLKPVLEEGSINIDNLEKDNGVLVVNNTYVYTKGRRKLVEGYYLKPGDEIQFSPYVFSEEAEDIDYDNLNVIGVLEREILEGGYNLNGGINIITTEKNFQNILGENSAHSSRIIVEMEDNFDPEPMRTYLDEKESSIPSFSYFDFVKSAEQGRTATTIVSIFLYGFVILITLISSINIINTISTNIILRTREISMVKAVGMTQRGIKRMVALESLFYGIYAAVIGGIIGTGLSYVMFNLVIRLSAFEWFIPWKNIAIACIGATIVALLSGIIPLKRINKGIIVENMKADE